MKLMVKRSYCNKCKNTVRVCVPEYADKEFYKEVEKHKLSVEDITLDKFNKKNKPFCSCP